MITLRLNMPTIHASLGSRAHYALSIAGLPITQQGTSFDDFIYGSLSNEEKATLAHAMKMGFVSVEFSAVNTAMISGIGDLLNQAGINIQESDEVRMGVVDDYMAVSKIDGTPRLRGNSTVYRDMVADLFGRQLSTTAGKVDYNHDENTLDFQSGGSITNANDRVGGNQEINHDMVVGNSVVFKPHIHWFQGSATACELTLRYRVQRNGQQKETSWTPITLTVGSSEVYPYSSGTVVQISSFPTITTDCGISDTIQFQMARTDSLGGTMSVFFFDIHAGIDALGSDEETSKSP